MSFAIIKKTGISTVFILNISLFFLSCNKESPEAVKEEYILRADYNAPAFSADTAYNYIQKQLSFGPRNPNSEGHQKTLNYIYSELVKFADEVKLQNFIYPGYDGEQLNLTNIIARINPANKNRIFICAHWDTRPRADQDKDSSKRNLPILGANDAGSGVGIILELARILKKNKIEYGIDFILFDGEDYGKEGDSGNYLLGSKYFAVQKPENFNPAFGIFLDLVGDKEAVFMKEGQSAAYAGDIVEMIWNIAAKVNANSFSEIEGSTILDDHVPLNQAGIKTIDIIDLELIGADTPNNRRNYWHTHNDTIDNIGKNTLQQVGDVLIHLIYSLQFSEQKLPL